MPDDPHAIIEVCVELRFERPASFGVVLASEISALAPGDERLVWLPKREIRTIQRHAGVGIVEIPRWLAEKEGLIDAIETVDPNQGLLL